MEGEELKKISDELKNLLKKEKNLFLLTEDEIKRKEERKKELNKIIKKEGILKKKREGYSRQMSLLEIRAKVFKNREAEIRAEKSKIEQKERKERDLIQRRKMEKKRWQVEERRREVEKKRWEEEDKADSLKNDFKKVEWEITEKIKPEKKKIVKDIERIEDNIKENKEKLSFIKKRILSKKKKRELLRKRYKEAIREAQEEKILVGKIREIAKEKREKEEQERRERERREREEQERQEKREKEEQERRERERREREEQERQERREKEEREEKERREREEREKQEEALRQAQDEKERREKEEREKRESQKKDKYQKDAQLGPTKEPYVDTNQTQSDDNVQEEEKNVSLEDDKELTKENQERDRKQIDIIKEMVEKERKSAQEEDSSRIKEKDPNDRKMTFEEAEALFKRAEQSLRANSIQAAKERFERIREEYVPAESKTVFNVVKGKPLNQKAEEYIKKLEKRKGDSENIRESEEASPVTKEVVRERVVAPDKEEIKREIEDILKEKQELKKKQEFLKEKKEEEKKTYLEELKEKEEEIQRQKEKLIEKEKRVDGEEKEEIRRQMKEMEEELKKLIEEETSKKWEKRISGVEEKVENIDKRYEELTQKEKQLRTKVKEIGEWGPELRKKRKEKDAFEYRSIYKTPSADEEKRMYSQEIRDDFFEEDEKKLEDKKKEKPAKKIRNWFKKIRPSEDFFLKAPLLVAIDISDFSVEVLCANNQGNLISSGRAKLEEGVVYNGDIRDKEKLRKVVLDIFKKAKPFPIEKKNNMRIKAMISLPESKIFLQQFRVGKNDNIFEKVKEEMSKFIPVPIEDIYFRHYTTSATKGEERRVMCIAVQKSVVKEYVEFLKSINVDPIIFDIEAASLGRALLQEEKKEKKREKKKKADLQNKKKEQKEEKKESEMIVDIGARSTAISVFCNDLLLFSTSIPFGGAYFTDKISKDLGISKEDAEEKKKKLGFEGEVKESLIFCAQTVIKEIKDAERYYEKEFDNKIIKIIVSGGSILLPGMIDYLQEELGEGVRMGEPLKKIKGTKGIIDNNGILFSNVIGLAIRAMKKDPIYDGLNMLPEEIKKREKRHQQERKKAIRFVAVVVAIVGALSFSYSIYYFLTIS